MNPQDTPNNILIDVDAESQPDLLSDAGTTPAGITWLESTACCFRPSARVGQDRVIIDRRTAGIISGNPPMETLRPALTSRR